MATSVDNHRQFRLDMNNVIRPLPRSDSPNRNNNNFSNTKTTNKPQIMLPTSMSRQSTHHDDSDSEEPDDSSSYWVEPLKKSVSEILEPSIHDPRDDGTSDSWIERNPSLIRLTGKHPFNSEPPLQRLMSYGFITPTQIHYVRNHGAVPQANFDTWSIEVTGLVRKPKTFTMNDLITKFKSIELPVTLVCAGNRRKEQNMVKQSIGFNWGAAAVSTSVWRGVCLVDVLKECGVMSRSKGAMNVCFEGAEDLPGGGGSKYGTSLKIEVAMDPSRDVMLAYMQNGEILEPDHGFPVRVIIPGFIGGRMVKWLKRIVVSSAESDSYYHFKDNRVLPSHVDAELANAEAWWYKPEYIINELNINSVITTPCHEEILPINSFTSQRSYTLKGYAYSGGGRKVTRVEVTMDGGETWHVCQLDIQEKPNKYGKYWCWCFWELEVEVLDLLAAKQIAVRAWDESLNTQPEKLIWNVMGMMNNCWFKVKTNVCRPHKGEIGIVFEHPTQPGNKPGGWMARERHIELTTERQTPTLKKSMSSPFINTATKMFSISEVKKHSSSDSAWIVVHGHVYDCTRFLKEHPGGADSILINAGTDCTEEFDAIHSDKAKKLLEDFRIGELITTGYSTDSAASSPNTSVHGGSLLSPTQTLAPIIEAAVSNNNMLVRSVALIPRQKIQCKLIEKVAISHDVRRFRFALPERDQVLGLPVGKHIFMCAMIDGKLCMRAYTPTSSDDEVGYFELVVKIYYKDQNPRFPNGGMMSQYLESLEIESVVEVKGPLGHIEYSGKGNFRVHGMVKKAHKLSMIAGGTGITPIYQIMQAILKDPEDETEMYVVYANRTEDDILLKDELDGWAKEYPERVQVWYVVQESIHDGWKYDIGFVTEGILRAHVPMAGEGVLALTCGPPPMIQFAVQPNLEKMGYDIKEELLVF